MIKKKDINSFLLICKRLNSLMRKIEKYNPEANYYLANDTLNLMNGPSHDDSNPVCIEEIYENVVEGVLIHKADGGDW